MKLELNEDSYKLLCDKYLSLALCEYNQFLFEKNQLNELINKYSSFRSELYSLQEISEDLTTETFEMESDLIHTKKTAEDLERENAELTKVLKTYDSRKIIKFSNKIYGPFSSVKEVAKKIFRKSKQMNSNRKTKNLPKTPNIQPNKPTKPYLKGLKNIKVAIILDEFSYNGFKYEFDAIPLEPTNWLEIMQTEKPDMLFCESAWSGGAWQGRIQYNGESEPENRAILLNLLQFCENNKVPTIFWNKEDPTNFNSFYDTALRFDHIFTTDEECVELYRDKYGHESVHCMLFAGQPRLFNPIETHERTDDIIFAGSWYVHHTERSKEMEQIFDNILRSGYNLKIYNRFQEFGKKHPNYRFPVKYHKYLNPPVAHNKIDDIYKESKYALNINTVTKSTTMFARRVFELMLCNTLILSNYSNGMYRLFDDNIVFVGSEKIDLNNSELKQMNNLYNVLKNHTYKNRFQEILDAIGYEYQHDENPVTMYYNINNKAEIPDVLKHYKSLDYYNKNLVLLSNQISKAEIKDIINNSTDEYEFYNYDDVEDMNIANNTEYFIFANTQLEEDFIDKAISHFSYIAPEFGVEQGEKFSFKYSEKIENVLFENENFNTMLNNQLKGLKTSFPVYQILI
jgi:hypothetical protein